MKVHELWHVIIMVSAGVALYMLRPKPMLNLSECLTTAISNNTVTCTYRHMHGSP